MKHLLVLIPFLMAATNVPFIDWGINWWAPASMGFCLGIGIAMFMDSRIQ